MHEAYGFSHQILSNDEFDCKYCIWCKVYTQCLLSVHPPHTSTEADLGVKEK